MKTYKYKLSPSDREDILYSADGFSEQEDAEEYLESLLTNYFPEGVLFEQSRVYLYRVLFFYGQPELNKDRLGKHWTGDPDNISDSDWVSLIRDANGYYSKEEKQFVLIGLFDVKKHIDIEHTLYNNLRYPNEKEYSLYNEFVKPHELYFLELSNFDNKNPLQSKGIVQLI
jgi:hypothetical protein